MMKRMPKCSHCQLQSSSSRDSTHSYREEQPTLLNKATKTSLFGILTNTSKSSPARETQPSSSPSPSINLSVDTANAETLIVRLRETSSISMLNAQRGHGGEERFPSILVNPLRSLFGSMTETMRWLTRRRHTSLLSAHESTKRPVLASR